MKELNQLLPSIEKLLLDAAMLKWPLAAGAVVLDYVLPTPAAREAAIGAFVLILGDTVSGFVAALRSREPISSAKFGRVLVKLLGYGLVLIVSAIVTNNLTGLDAFESYGAMAILTLIITTEAISVLENVHKMGLTLPFGLSDVLKARLVGQKKPEE